MEDRRHGVVFQPPLTLKITCYDMLHGVSDLDGFFEVIQSRIRGARHVEHMGHGKTTNKTLV